MSVVNSPNWAQRSELSRSAFCFPFPFKNAKPQRFWVRKKGENPSLHHVPKSFLRAHENPPAVSIVRTDLRRETLREEGEGFGPPFRSLFGGVQHLLLCPASTTMASDASAEGGKNRASAKIFCISQMQQQIPQTKKIGVRSFLWPLLKVVKTFLYSSSVWEKRL
ncbi:hypothetical protein TNIN_14891 [Trichonephila inaurata madagascariensis]|uniref:Uncharacterized protein n=1 Tax=Trichonephila inaurata madagascariensis TaxID=2747483 RepID=A0A8X6YTQ5_9ARAC|nr:hypothetical protein TNIN_14891 [Trichonephila inaurata madagascariensis]